MKRWSSLLYSNGNMYVAQIAYIITIESYSSIKLNLVSTIVQLQRVYVCIESLSHPKTQTYFRLSLFLALSACSNSFAMFGFNGFSGERLYSIPPYRSLSSNVFALALRFELLLWFAFNPSKIEYYYTEFAGWIENIYADRQLGTNTHRCGKAIA